MAEIIFTRSSLADFDRLFTFLAKDSLAAAEKAGQAILSRISMLEHFPEMVAGSDDHLRILTVPFGRRGYSIAYHFNPDSVRLVILGMKHQTEEFYPFELEPQKDLD